MMRQTREAMVRTMGVKMQAKRPSLPILTVSILRCSIKQCKGWGLKLIGGNGRRRLWLSRWVKRVNVESVDV